MVTPWLSTVSPGWVSSQLPPVSAARSTTTLPAGNLPTTVPIGFKVKEGATGTANVRLNGLIFDLGGRQVPIPASGAAAVQLQAQ